MKAFQPALDAIEWGAFQIGSRDELATALGLAVCDRGSAPGMLLLEGLEDWPGNGVENEATPTTNYRAYLRRVRGY